MSQVVVLVGCSSLKLSHPAPAEQLYRGALFRTALNWARRHHGPGAEIAVLSAKHGVVRIDQLVAPYEAALESMARPEREVWGAKVREQLAALYPGAHFVVLAGPIYREHLDGLDVECPIAGLRIDRAAKVLAC